MPPTASVSGRRVAATGRSLVGRRCGGGPRFSGATNSLDGADGARLAAGDPPEQQYGTHIARLPGTARDRGRWCASTNGPGVTKG